MVMMNDIIRVAVVDDYALFREAVAQILGAESDIQIVGQGASADDAIRITRDELPNILLLDIGMPGGGLTSARAVTAHYPATKIVMLTASQEEEDVMAAFRAGVSAYVLKGVSGRELISIVRRVSAGQCYVSPAAAAGLER